MKTERLYRVSFQGNRLVFPAICPCCGGVPDAWIYMQYKAGETYNILTTTQHFGGVKVPYCSRCVKHRRFASENGCLFVLALILGAVLLQTMFAALGAEQAETTITTIVVCACIGLGAPAYVYQWQKRRIAVAMSGTCCTRRDAVYFSPGVFEFKNRSYALAFFESNKHLGARIDPKDYVDPLPADPVPDEGATATREDEQPASVRLTGLTWHCSCGETNVKSAKFCRLCDAKRPEIL